MLLPALLAGSLALGPATGEADVPDAALDAALHTLYDGGTDTALAAFAALAAAHPGDPLPIYFQALALAWRVEQTPERRDRDAELLELAARTISLAERRLRERPGDIRALLARGAAHGVAGRLHLFRADRGGSVREAVAMRRDLLRVLELDPANEEARFGTALYDYYADVLPRLLKLVRFLLGMPGGDRGRGLAGLRRAASASRWHGAEALAQLYDLGAYYEADPDGALGAIRALRARYPGAPLWALRLGEHLRDRLGLYAESAAVYAEVEAAAAAGHPNYAPVVAALAGLGRGEALLRDLRLDAARRALETLAARPFPRLEARRLSLLARLDAAGADPVSRARGEARRLSEAGSPGARDAWSALLRLRPRDLEAALRRGEDALRQGRLVEAARDLERVRRAERPDPPWLGPAARLALARVREAQGQATDAVDLYKEVFRAPGGSGARRAEAREALRRLGAPAPPDTAPSDPSRYSR